MSGQKLNTKNYARKVYKASEITSEGLEMTAESLVTKKGTFGDYWHLNGIINDESAALAFSGEKLYDLLTKAESVVMGNRIRIVPSGKDKEREYEIEIL